MTEPRAIPLVDHVVMGLYLEYRRHMAGLTIKQLAIVSGVDVDQISLCCDTRSISPEAVIGLCGWLCRDPEFFSKEIIDEIRKKNRSAWLEAFE